METSRPVAVIGSGYVGTVVAGCLAHLGHEVVGIEMEPSRLAALRSARAPFHEAKIDDILRGAAESGRLCFTDDLAGAVADAGVVFLCVGTPPGNDGHADVGAVQEAAQAAAAASHDAKVFVTKSTVPIGSGHWLENVVEDARPRDAEGKVAIVSNP